MWDESTAAQRELRLIRQPGAAVPTINDVRFLAPCRPGWWTSTLPGFGGLAHRRVRRALPWQMWTVYSWMVTVHGFTTGSSMASNPDELTTQLEAYIERARAQLDPPDEREHYWRG